MPKSDKIINQGSKKISKVHIPVFAIFFLTEILFDFKISCHAQVVKLVDTPDLGSGAERCVGSSPILGN
jgi:hypothetical protein